MQFLLSITICARFQDILKVTTHIMSMSSKKMRFEIFRFSWIRFRKIRGKNLNFEIFEVFLLISRIENFTKRKCLVSVKFSYCSHRRSLPAHSLLQKLVIVQFGNSKITESIFLDNTVHIKRPGEDELSVLIKRI